MPLQLDPYDDSPLCKGFTWTVLEPRRLARVVAWLVIGDFLHARDILLAVDRDIPEARRSHLDRLVAELRTQPQSDPVRWHRDGWIFQMLSWIALNLADPREKSVRAPQPRKADKGIDGLAVVGRVGDDPAYIVICEDKATGSPRPTITGRVWPELTAFEAGDRDTEVSTELGALLERIANPTERRTLLKEVLWESDWRYRIAITVGDSHRTREARAALFAGYDECVAGGISARRQAETVEMEDLREWMDAFCSLVADEIEAVRGQADV